MTEAGHVHGAWTANTTMPRDVIDVLARVQQQRQEQHA